LDELFVPLKFSSEKRANLGTMASGFTIYSVYLAPSVHPKNNAIYVVSASAIYRSKLKPSSPNIEPD
jgi:hypothetical protein